MSRSDTKNAANRSLRGACGVAVAGLLLLAGCASLGLGDVLQPPQISSSENRGSELRLVPPSGEMPSGGAAIRLWARVENPNPLGVNLSALAGDLFLRDRRSAGVDLPLGVPLAAGADTVIPLDISIGFEDVPALADIAREALVGGSLDYRLDGTVTVDAGALGTPTFGPSTLLRGELQVLRGTR